MQRPRWLLFVLLAVLHGAALAQTAEDAATLARYAQALRAQPGKEAYARLERFGEQHRGTELGARAALALGRADFGEQRWARAGEHFSRAAAGELLGDYGLFYGAQTQRLRGTPQDALATLEEFYRRHPGSRLEEAARVEQAAVLVELGRAAEARNLLTGQPDWERRPALLLALARAQAAAGELEAAVQTLHRLYYEFPLSQEAEPGNQLLSELRPRLAERYIQPSETLRLRRADELWAAQAYQGARSAYLDLSVRASEPTRRLARLRAAQSFYYLGGGNRACAELERIRDIDAELEAEWRANQAQCRWRADDPDGFQRELGALAARFPTSPWYAQSLFAGGGYFLAADDRARARPYFEQVLERFPSSEWAPESQWKLAWIAYRENDLARAARMMEEHLGRFPGSALTPQALYWRARIAERQGEVGLAARLGELLRTHFPRHYLGQQGARAEWAQAPGGVANGEQSSESMPAWLAGIRLSRPALDVPPLPDGLALILERALALEQLGLAEFATEEAKSALDKAPHLEAYLVRARVASSLSRYAESIEWLRRSFPSYSGFALEELPRSLWELLFPRIYWDSIERHARHYGLDPYLVLAVIHQESHFERQAVSSAGARGLMQLMPDTARHLAGVRRLNPERLFEPEFNIRLGTRFLRQLRDRFRGQLELMLAAYNAGGTRVAEWHRRQTWSEPAEFVESIPAAQTREFVYVVLRNYQFYRDLYATK